MAITTDTTPAGQALHDLAVNRIAESRFGLDDWEVRTNTASDAHDASESIVPDIVAENCRQIVAVGEVETLDAVSDERARLWKAFGESCVRFYLYIPEGAELKAAQLIAKHKVECAGLRCYSLNGHLEVKSVPIDNARCRDDNHPWWTAIGGCDKTC